jgi:hypothetical protein
MSKNKETKETDYELIFELLNKLLNAKGKVHGELRNSYGDWYWNALLLLKIDRLKYNILHEGSPKHKIETSIDVLGYLFLFFKDHLPELQQYIEEELGKLQTFKKELES